MFRTRLGQKRCILYSGLVAIVGHLIGVVADIYSGYVPDVETQLGSITSLSLANIATLLASKSLGQARIGHYLAVFFIPLGVLGIWQVFLGLSEGRSKLALVFLIAGSLGIIYATFYHGTLAFVSGALHMHSGASNGLDLANEFSLLAYFNSLSEPLGQVLLVADLLVSSIYAITLLTSVTRFPKWMAIVNPLTIQLILSTVSLLAPHPIDQLAWLTVFNASMALWYAVTTFVLSKSVGDVAA